MHGVDALAAAAAGLVDQHHLVLTVHDLAHRLGHRLVGLDASRHLVRGILNRRWWLLGLGAFRLVGSILGQ